MPRLGAHMSISGGVDKALHRGREVGCETIQVFTKAPNRWAAHPLDPAEVERFQQAFQEFSIKPVFAHDAYLINLASPEKALWKRSLKAFQDEVERCQVLGLPYLVTHAGSHKGVGEEEGLERIVEALNIVCEATSKAQVQILLETTAGQGSYLCYRFEHLAWILEHALYPERLGVCLDTCHIFAAGYDIRTPATYEKTFSRLDATVGLGRVKVFHLNDTLKELGSRVDRHTHIGEGQLGLETFRLLLNDPRFQDRPMVLETPKGPDMEEDRQNLAVLRALLKSL
jgi:deoxyribonuclease-4